MIVPLNTVLILKFISTVLLRLNVKFFVEIEAVVVLFAVLGKCGCLAVIWASYNQGC